MQALRFDAAIERIVDRDRRFEPGAYFLLKEALDFTLKRTREESGEERHVSGKELVHGFRDYALQEFGPMAHTLLREWGVHTCRDVGDMVFLLIEEGMFGKQDSDTREDFCDHYEFDEAFLKPFLPREQAVIPTIRERAAESLEDADPDPDTDADADADEETPISPETQDAT